MTKASGCNRRPSLYCTATALDLRSSLGGQEPSSALGGQWHRAPKPNNFCISPPSLKIGAQDGRCDVSRAVGGCCWRRRRRRCRRCLGREFSVPNFANRLNVPERPHIGCPLEESAVNAVLDEAVMTHPFHACVRIHEQYVVEFAGCPRFGCNQVQLAELLHATAPGIDRSLAHEARFGCEGGGIFDGHHGVVGGACPKAEERMSGGLPFRGCVNGLHHDRKRTGNRDEPIVPLAMPEPRVWCVGKMDVEQLLCAICHFHTLGRSLLSVCHFALQQVN